MWAYIKEHGLQDPSDKRFIICDDNLRTIFPTPKVHMFTMNKLLSGHLFPIEGAGSPAKSEDIKSEDLKSEDFPNPMSPISNQGTPSSEAS